MTLIIFLYWQETAISVFYPREDVVDQGYTTFGYMKMQMVVAHGGRCAENIVFGDDITDGGRDDLEKITRVRERCLILDTCYFDLVFSLFSVYSTRCDLSV